ncbi:PAS domain-containing protein [Symbioplanes lichenis]|uniref:PAS domain-containing protein n=1 Tax=Symbioplanes lichenis TaxID=1629072 RepID=UPI0027384399|nr:PAS domain S-box protein [Actinoplanes lichenis]
MLYLFARSDVDGMLLYLPGATLILVLATALFTPAVVIGLGALALAGFLALQPFESSFQPVAVLGMMLIMASVVAVNAIIAHSRGRLDARRRSAERRVEALLEHSSDLVVALAGEGRIRYASPSVSAVLGRDPGRLTGDLVSTLVHPDDLVRVQGWIREVWSAPATETARTEMRLRRAGGSVLFVDAIATNRLGDPDVQAVIVSLRDIGTRRALEQQLSH